MISSQKAKLKKVIVQNIHPKCRMSKKETEDIVEKVLRWEGVNSPVDVIFVDDEFMQKMNRKFTSRKKTTDVLSFGMREGENMGIDYPGLGDIYVSLDQAKRQAAEYGICLKEETSRLVIHGLLHLLGYDHKDKRQAKIMKKKEEAYLNRTVWSKA